MLFLVVVFLGGAARVKKDELAKSTHTREREREILKYKIKKKLRANILGASRLQCDFLTSVSVLER